MVNFRYNFQNTFMGIMHDNLTYKIVITNQKKNGDMHDIFRYNFQLLGYYTIHQTARLVETVSR